MRKLIAMVTMILIVTATTAQAREPRHDKERTKDIICHVFGKRYCSQALGIAHCETGGTYDIWAGFRKHQYWGLFQMGTSERRQYGHAWNAWEQSRAARRYFIASGRDWSPWSCRWAAYG